MTPHIEELIRRIEAAGEVFEWYGPQSAESIDDLEAALGVTLPPSYRAFLARYGGGGVQAMSGFAGIWRGNARLLNAGCTYGDTVRLRAERGLPDSLVLIHAIYGSEEHFPPACLDVSRRDPNGECPVVHYSVLSQQIVPPEFATFADYMTDDLSATLDVLLEEQGGGSHPT